jgi:hypothetical protein
MNPDSTLAVFFGPHRLADYDVVGVAVIQSEQRAA